jgi:glycosidase
MSISRAIAFSLTFGSACAPERTCGVEVWWVDKGEADSVSVVGAFNGWDPAADPLRMVDPGVWKTHLELPPGDHPYLLRVDGRVETDPYNPLLDEDPRTSAERSLARVPACEAPVLSLSSLHAAPDGKVAADLQFFRGVNGPRLAEVRASVGGKSLPVDWTASSGQISVVARGLAEGRHELLVVAADGDGRSDRIWLPFWVEKRAFSWEGALIYQIMIDRFANADGALSPQGALERHGGTLAGVTRRLEEGWFADLGVQALWLSPVLPNTRGTWPDKEGRPVEAYHGYWPIASEGIEPALGTPADLERLVDTAHAQGIRVLLDVIPNHVHQEHPWADRPSFANGDGDCLCGATDCPWSSEIEDCWFTPYLPDLDWSEPEVRSAQLESLAQLGYTTRVDGFRVDAVPMVPRAAIREVVAGLRPRLGAGPTGFFLLGETFTGPGETGPIRRNLGPHGLNGQFDFPVMWALRGFLAWDSMDASEFELALQASEAAWRGSGAVMSPFVGNHDVARFLSEAAGDPTQDPHDQPPPLPLDREPFERLVLAQTVALTLPGAPVIWQGDEIGLAGANDPDNRRPMPEQLAAEQEWTLSRVRRLGLARRCSPALSRGRRVPLVAEGGVLIYSRDVGDGEPALVVVNRGAATRVRFTLPEDLRFARVGEWSERLEADSPIVIGQNATVELSLPARSARLYLPSAQLCEGEE